MTVSVLFAVACGGALGAVARYLAVLLAHSWIGSSPWPVALVNIAGCFGFGLCWALAHDRWSPTIAAAVLAGFFGAFTTFSAFAGDCHALLVERRFALLLGNLMVHNLLGIAALWLGIHAVAART